MSRNFETTPQILLGSAVANAGTFTVAYPTGTDEGAFAYNANHKLMVNGDELQVPADFTLTLGTSNITVTNASGYTWAEGSRVRLQLDRGAAGVAKPIPDKVQPVQTVRIDLGAPDAADADGVCASQAGTAATAMTINGALAAGGVATFDVPRNVVAAWTNTATITVTGTDEYGVRVVETSGSGTSFAGKKAFKTVTSVVPSANITGATVGTGDVLGLPIFLRSVSQVLREMADNATPTAGTTVAGVLTEPSATTGDVRGTYDPNSACDGQIVFSLIVATPDPGDRGLTQFGG